MDSETNSKQSVLMIVPNKFVKKLFEYVLKSDKMKAFVKEYQDDGPDWLDQLIELMVAFSTTMGDDCRFSKLEKFFRIKFRVNLRELMEKRKAEETNTAVSKLKETKVSRCKAAEGKESVKSNVNQPIVQTDVSTAATGSKKSFNKSKIHGGNLKLKPVLPQTNPGNKLKRKRDAKVEVTSPDNFDEKLSLTKTSSDRKLKTEQIKKIRNANDEKKKCNVESSGNSHDKKKDVKPKEKKTLVQGAGDDAIKMNDDDDLFEIFRCPVCKEFFEKEQECNHHIEVMHN